MAKKTFETHDELKEIYDKRKFDIFYENGDIKYIVEHIGSTILCFDEKRKLGMGAVQNFDIKRFYGVEKPEPKIEIVSGGTEDNE